GVDRVQLFRFAHQSNFRAQLLKPSFVGFVVTLDGEDADVHSFCLVPSEAASETPGGARGPYQLKCSGGHDSRQNGTLQKLTLLACVASVRNRYEIGIPRFRSGLRKKLQSSGKPTILLSAAYPLLPSRLRQGPSWRPPGPG